MEMVEIFTSADVKRIYKLTQKQLHDLDESDIIKPSLREARGKGSIRLYSYEDLLSFHFIRSLLDANWTLRTIKVAIKNLKAILPEKDPLHDFVILNVNGSIYARCSTENGQEQIIDALTRGQLVMPVILSEIQQKVIQDIKQLKAA